MNATNQLIPGTILPLSKAGGAIGGVFLDNIFYISDGIMLSYIREITGIDGTTLQNWVKRGWVLNPKNKLYSKEQLARILIINMVRDTMQLSKITELLIYINGDIEDSSDDIIPESMLYDYLCRVMEEYNTTGRTLDDIIEDVTVVYNQRPDNAAFRLRKAMKIILLSYIASNYKRLADEEMYGIMR